MPSQHRAPALSARRRRLFSAVLIAVFWGADRAPDAAGSVASADPDLGVAAAANPGFDGAPALGLAHVDVMDLHLARTPSGGVVRREVLPPGDLAERFDRASAAGAAIDRWSLYWDMVDTPSGYDWSVVDEMVSRDVQGGLQPLLILQGTPARYATGGSTAPPPGVGGGLLAAELRSAAPTPIQASPPRGLDQPVFVDISGAGTDDPARAVAVNAGNPWAAFVAAAAERYRPGGFLARAQGWPATLGVRHWEVGNEPNLAHFWSGTVAEFARYLEVAYLALEFEDGDAVVMHGGIADSAGALSWFGALLDALDARAASSPLPARYGYYFDKTAWHWYVYPDLLRTGPAAVREALTSRGLPDKGVWVTELGAPIWSEHPGPCWDPLSPWRVTAVEQAAYVWQATAEAAASDVEALVFFQAYDDCGNGPASYDAFGLSRNHTANQCWADPGQACWRFDESLAGAARPALGAFASAVDRIGGTELLWRPPETDTRWQRVLLVDPPDRRVTVAWNWSRQAQTATLAATGPSATLMRIAGDGSITVDEVTPDAGLYRLELPGATNRNNPGNAAPVLAGRPALLVERDTVPPFRARIEPLPEESPPSTSLTLSAADGGTGVTAYVVLASDLRSGEQPTWWVLVPESPWPALPRGGEARVAVQLVPGSDVAFAARARDRAGNWSDVPAEPQAWTHVVGERPTITPGPSPTTAPIAATLHVPVALVRSAGIAGRAGR